MMSTVHSSALLNWPWRLAQRTATPTTALLARLPAPCSLVTGPGHRPSSRRTSQGIQQNNMASSPHFLSPKKGPRPYYAFNPAMLDSKEFSYRKLQQLSMQLGLGGRGKRSEIVARLRRWHVQKHSLSMVQIVMATGTTENTTHNQQQHSSSSSCISPRFLSPFRKKRNRKKANGNLVGILSPSRIGRRESSQDTPSSKRLKFSIVNGVKIIPSRAELESHDCLYRYQPCYYEDDDDYDDY